jgi:hypothetical protein
MLNTEPQVKIKPPRLIPSLVEGFNSIARQIHLILFPIIVDLLLWFGPLVRIKNLLMPVINQAAELSGTGYSAQGNEIIKNSNQVWSAFLEGFNLLFSIRTYPIGIPSLMVSQGALNNPLGGLRIIEINSINTALMIMFVLSLLGVVFGSLYFALVARALEKEPQGFNYLNLVRFTGQSILLSLLLVAAVIVLGIPAMCLMSSIILFLPGLGTLPFLVLGVGFVWILLPFAFSPHGIFLRELKAGNSIISSVRLVRSMMAGTGMFFIMVIFLGYGLDALWSTPGAGSWMMLVGIFGHGFISSGLLAASFVFYRDGIKWFDENLREKQAALKKAEF